MLTSYYGQIFTDELLDKKQRLPVDKVLHFLQKQPDGNKLVITYLVSIYNKNSKSSLFSVSDNGWSWIDNTPRNGMDY